MKDTSSLGDIEYRNLLAVRYSQTAEEREERTAEVRLARLEGFVYGMAVMSVIVMCVSAYFLGAV